VSFVVLGAIHRVIGLFHGFPADFLEEVTESPRVSEKSVVTLAQFREPMEAVRINDDYAPEHLELHIRDADHYFSRLKNYGSLFIGEETTVAYGDKAIGMTHILPTSRSARYTGGVWVERYSIIR